MSVTNESEAKISKAVDDIMAVFTFVTAEFTEEEGILFFFRLEKAMKEVGLA